MKTIIIMLCILFIVCDIKIEGNHNSYMKFRNYTLRLLVSDEYAALKKMIAIQNVKIRYLKNITSKKMLKLYDKCLSKYYDANIAYNSLSEDELLMLETILSLCY